MESQFQKRYQNLGEDLLLRCHSNNFYSGPGSCYLQKQVALGIQSLRGVQHSVCMAELLSISDPALAILKIREQYRSASWICIQMKMKMHLHLTKAENCYSELWPQNTQNHLVRGRRDVVFRSNSPDFASYGRWQLSKAVKICGFSEHPSVDPLRAYYRRKANLVT